MANSLLSRLLLTLSDDTDGVTVTFNNSNGLVLSLAKKGHLTKGRMVHITGHISGVTEVYEKDGVTQLLKRPRLIAGLQHCTAGVGCYA